MTIYVQSVITFLQLYCITNILNGEIIAEPTHQQHQYPHLHLTTPSNIRLIEHESSSSDYDYNHRQENYKRPKYKLAKPHKKSNYLKSLISGVEDAVENVSGWGWDKKQEVYQIKGAKFSLLDILLSGLSLVSFGAFLMNLLTNLLSLLGFGYFTTATIPTGTIQTGTTTAVGIGSPAVSDGIVASISNYFRSNLTPKNKRKKKKGKKRIHVQGGFDGQTTTDLEHDYDYPINDFSSAGSSESGEGSGFSDRGNNKMRKKRSIWNPNINPTESLDIASQSILNSIKSIENGYECMEKAVCQSNKYAKIIGQGLDYFMPIFSFHTSYYGYKNGLHEKLPDHLSAIILGFKEESNCNINFPQC